MGDPNNMTCFRCGHKAESYDEAMFAWKSVIVEGKDLDFCPECLNVLMIEWAKCIHWLI